MQAEQAGIYSAVQALMHCTGAILGMKMTVASHRRTAKDLKQIQTQTIIPHDQTFVLHRWWVCCAGHYAYTLFIVRTMRTFGQPFILLVHLNLFKCRDHFHALASTAKSRHKPSGHALYWVHGITIQCSGRVSFAAESLRVPMSTDYW